MADCEECDKNLGIFEGYHHPALGQGFVVCGKCFDKVDGDMKRWSKFCLLDSLNVDSSKIDIQDSWDENISDDPLLQKWFNRLWVKIGPTPLAE
jgi:hypothetical protein